MAKLEMGAFSIDPSAMDMGDFMSEPDEVDVPQEPTPPIDNIPSEPVDDKPKDLPLPTEDDEIPTEEDDEDIKDTDIKGGSDATSTGSSPKNPYSSFAKTLASSLPYLDLKDKEIKTAQDLVDFYEESIEGEVKNREFSDLTDNQKYYLEAIRTGVPEETVRGNISFEESLNDITEEDIQADPELRKDIIKQAYILRGFSDNEAEKQVQRSISVGEDIDDALSYKEALSKYVADKKQHDLQTAQAAVKARQDKINSDLATLKERIDKPEEVLPGVNMSTKFKTDLYDMITKPAGEIEGRSVNWLTKWLSEDPINNQLKLAYMFKVTEGFKNPEASASKKTKSKAIKDLDSILNTTNFDATGVFNPNTDDEDSTFGSQGLKIDLD